MGLRSDSVLSTVMRGVTWCRMHGAAFAESDIVVTANAATGSGVWDIAAACQMTTNIPYNSDEAYVLFRSGVPYTHTWDNSNRGIVHSDSGKKWHIVPIGYGSGGSFTYTIQYQHTTWLAGANPSGECAMYIGSTDALNDATNGYELEDTPADPSVSYVALVHTGYSHPIMDAGCSFAFYGKRFGPLETVIIIDYKVPITNLNDYNGGSVMFISDDGTWSKSTCPHGAKDTYQFNVRFELVTTDQGWSSAECYMYTAASTSNLTSAMSWSSFLMATSSPSTISTASMSTGLPIITTPNPLPAQNNATEGVTTLSEVKYMRNKFEDSGNIWQRSTSNILRCARYCRADPACYSVFFEETISRCTAHSTFISSGIEMSTKVRYFILK
ncbi:hypothetical protein ACF0H5_002571 [Mactra antiquata]